MDKKEERVRVAMGVEAIHTKEHGVCVPMTSVEKIVDRALDGYRRTVLQVLVEVGAPSEVIEIINSIEVRHRQTVCDTEQELNAMVAATTESVH